MGSRLRPLRVLLPAGLLSGGVVASRLSRCEAEDKDAGASGPSGEPPQSEALSTRLAMQLEAWLMPSEDTESLGLMVKDLSDAVSEDIEMSTDQSTRLPLNFLMVKAMHDRELMVTRTRAKRKSALHDKSRGGDRLSPRDQRMLRRSAHFARFAAASYDGFLDNVQEIVADEAVEELPPDLLSKSTDYLRKWCVSKRTGIELEDVAALATSDSAETRAYFVAVDHASRSVIVSIRGTYCFTDTMVDLLCKPVEDFAGGRAHQGISQSATRVWKGVQGEVESQLKKHGDYKLVLTGHSLGAGTAILLKLLLAYEARQASKGGAGGKSKGNEKGDAKIAPTGKLDVGRPVRVECYAFAPPPVFSAVGAEWIRDTYSFVNGADCVPTMSMGSLYDLCRTIRNVDQLPLDVYKRAEFVLDTRVRVQLSEEGRAKEDSDDGRHKIVLDILKLRSHPSLAFLAQEEDELTNDSDDPREESGDIWAEEEEDDDDAEEEERQRAERRREAEVTAAEDDDEEDDSVEDGGIMSTLGAMGAEVVRSTMSVFEGDWGRFTADVSDAAENLLDAVDRARASAGSLYDDVGRITEGMSGMSSDEVALTALLVKQLAVGGGPSTDQVLSLVQKCERNAKRPKKKGRSTSSETLTAGDLVIPGSVYLMEGWNAQGDGAQALPKGEGAGGSGKGRKDRSKVSVRKTSSDELGGIRLNSNMMADHVMGSYEPAILAAVERYSKR
ncbi:unnamed protein product [Scytosiphon promiscuus]